VSSSSHARCQDGGFQGSPRLRLLLSEELHLLPDEGGPALRVPVALQGYPEPGETLEAFAGLPELRRQGVHHLSHGIHPVPEHLHLLGEPGGEVPALAAERGEAALQDLAGGSIESLRILRKLPGEAHPHGLQEEGEGPVGHPAELPPGGLPRRGRVEA